MRWAAPLAALLLVPALVAPAAGLVDGPVPALPALPEVPDRAFVLVMRGHEFNGLAYPDTPLLEAYLGDTVRFTVLVPPLAEDHTFHLHGHPWRVEETGVVVDTFLVRPGQSHAFTVTAGGEDAHAGDWMYHCHFDDHVRGGMWGVFRVYGYRTDVVPLADGLDVTLGRLGVPVEGATLSATLDGEPVPAHVAPAGDGRYRVHTGPLPAAGVLVVRAAHHALGESVARVGLGGTPVPVPTLAEESGLPREAMGTRHPHA